MAAPTEQSSTRGRRKASSRGHHRFVGVRQRPSGRWVAEIKDSLQKVRLWLGTFDTADDAARAYDDAARALRGANARTNFELPQSASNPLRPGRSPAEKIEPFSFEEVCGSGTEADGLLGALKAKLLDGKGLQARTPLNCPQGVRPSVAVNSNHSKITEKREISSLSLNNPTGYGAMSPVRANSNINSKPDQLLDHVNEANTQWLNQPSSSLVWSNEPAYEAPWPAPEDGLFSITNTASTSSWQPDHFAYPNQYHLGEFLTNKSSKINNNSATMSMSQIHGAMDLGWTTSDQQQLLHCDNNGWSGGANGSWDPLLYMSSVLG